MNSKTYTLGLFFIIAVFSCVQKTHVKNIHFKIDMNGLENISKVGLRGDTQPLSWDRSIPLLDENNDEIYETQIQLNSASYDLQFKFVLNNSEFELEGLNNRSIIFDYQPETIFYDGVFNNLNQINVTKE